MVSISQPKSIGLVGLLLVIVASFPVVHAFTYQQNLPSNAIYFDDFGNYTTPSPCATAALACLPGWGAYDNATGGIANITTWHPLSSSGKSMLMGAASGGQSKFDRHRSWVLLPGQTRITISQWFQLSDNARVGNFPNRNEIHFSLESNDGANFHECLMEYFPASTTKNAYVAVNDAVFNFNMSLGGFDIGGFTNNPNSIWSNNQWHYEKITMDFTSLTAPTCPYMQMDNLIVSSLTNGQGWVTTPSTPASYSTTSTTHANTDYSTANGYQYTRPLRLEIAMIKGNAANPQYFTWHTNILVTDDSPGNPTIVQFGLTAFSAWYPVLIAAIGVLYGTSGIGLLRRVILDKTTGMLSSYKLIFLTGLIASIGFILILVLGSFATQQVCQNTHGATCKY